MAGKTNSDRILELERQISALVERVERLREDWRGSGTASWREEIVQVSGRIELVAQDLGRAKDDLKELKAIRWEIWKMILTPLVSAVLSAIVSGVVASIVVQKSPGAAIEQAPRSPANRP